MQIFWIRIDKLKYNDFFRNLVKLEKQYIVFTPNPEILLKTRKDNDFKELLKKANYLTADWIGLYIAFQIIDNKYWAFLNILFLPYFFFNLFFRKTYLYKKYWDRICGSDLTKDLIDFSISNSIKISIIDLYNPNDSKKVASQDVFSEKLKKIFPKLEFDYYIYNPSKKDEIIEKIKNSNSKILFSTLGMKKQEQSIIDIIQVSNNIKIWVWVWSSFDYFIWFQKRAPKLWRAFWFEWLYRLLTWPKKIDRLRRLYNAIFVFTYKIIISKNV